MGTCTCLSNIRQSKQARQVATAYSRIPHLGQANACNPWASREGESTSPEPQISSVVLPKELGVAYKVSDCNET